MKKFESLDPEGCPEEDKVNIELYPDFLGHETDITYTNNKALEKLCEIDWFSIYEACVGTKNQSVVLTIGNDTFPVDLDVDFVSMLLDQLPAIDVANDTEGGAYVWFLAEGSTEKQMEQQVTALTNWLKSLPAVV